MIDPKPSLTQPRYTEISQDCESSDKAMMKADTSAIKLQNARITVMKLDTTDISLEYALQQQRKKTNVMSVNRSDLYEVDLQNLGS